MFKHYFYFPGKVHGSLARAGKVKGATPKVITTFLFCVTWKMTIYLLTCMIP